MRRLGDLMRTLVNTITVTTINTIDLVSQVVACGLNTVVSRIASMMRFSWSASFGCREPRFALAYASKPAQGRREGLGKRHSAAAKHWRPARPGSGRWSSES